MNRTQGRTKALVLGSSVAIAAMAWGPAAAAPTASGGGSASFQQAADACGTDPVTLNVWGGYPENDEVYRQAGEAFTALHPNVSFTIFSTDLRGFEQKLVTALPTNTAGDVVIRTTNFLARFIDEGLLQALPDDLKATVNGGDYHPAVVQDSTYADGVWGVPLFTGGTAVFYNTDMYTEAAITEPPTSMDALIANAYKTFKVDGAGDTTRSGWSLRLSGQGSGVAEKFWILLLQDGKTLIRETPEGSGKWVAEYNGPEGVKLFQMYVDMLRDGVDSINIEHDAAAFEKQLTAQFLRESWVVPEIATSAPDLVGHYATIAPPVADILTVESAFVPAAAAHPECSWEFIRFLREPEQQQNLIKVSGWLPARQGLDYTDLLAQNPGFAGFLTGRENLARTVTPAIPEFDEIETKLAGHLVEGYADYANLAGNPDAIQALLNGWADETNQILKDNDHFGG
ncbi:MAG: extracellular solute-binding protein [Chloroflexi bacterium]|nr:extracellular solute-binding protein [Chloroflexota bacterium]